LRLCRSIHRTQTGGPSGSFFLVGDWGATDPEIERAIDRVSQQSLEFKLIRMNKAVIDGVVRQRMRAVNSMSISDEPVPVLGR
jgi:hypothetical protein